MKEATRTSCCMHRVTVRSTLHFKDFVAQFHKVACPLYRIITFLDIMRSEGMLL